MGLNFEPSTSHKPALKAEPLSRWYGRVDFNSHVSVQNIFVLATFLMTDNNTFGIFFQF